MSSGLSNFPSQSVAHQSEELSLSEGLNEDVSNLITVIIQEKMAPDVLPQQGNLVEEFCSLIQRNVT